MGGMCNASKYAEGNGKSMIKAKVTYNACKLAVCKPLISSDELIVYPQEGIKYIKTYNFY